MVVPVQNPAVIGYFEPAVKCYSNVVKPKPIGLFRGCIPVIPTFNGLSTTAC